MTFNHKLLNANCALPRIGEKIDERLSLNGVLWRTQHSAHRPLLPSTQGWVIFCFSQIVYIVAQHCLEVVGKERLIFFPFEVG